jgi:hypothetical protein
MMDINTALNKGRATAIGVNPKPYVTHHFTVLKKLRLVDDEVPNGFTGSVWESLLDHWDSDASVGLGRGVVYIVGDDIEVDRFEAADLLTLLPEYFEPADELTRSLKTALEAPNA